MIPCWYHLHVVPRLLCDNTEQRLYLIYYCVLGIYHDTILQVIFLCGVLLASVSILNFWRLDKSSELVKSTWIDLNYSPRRLFLSLQPLSLSGEWLLLVVLAGHIETSTFTAEVLCFFWSHVNSIYHLKSNSSKPVNVYLWELAQKD